MSEKIVISTRDINKYFGKTQVLSSISISVASGEIFGFIGKNGAGKTTFMRILTGLMKPSSGAVDVFGRIGFLPQNVRLQDNRNAVEVIRFFAALKDSESSQSLKLVRELEIDMNKRVRDLSPGQQRKLQLIIAAIGNPDILVLDEPTAGLDPVGVQQVRELIRKLNHYGCTVFISSHILLELDSLCSGVAVVDRGHLLYQGSCRSVYEIDGEFSDERILGVLPDLHREKCRFSGGKLVASMERQDIPELLRILCTNNVNIFEIRQLGLESLYHSLLKEGA